MQFESINIRHCSFDGFQVSGIDGLTHVKQLCYLSIVQSVKGSYGIQLDHGPAYETGEGGFFIAPSIVTQHIVHHTDRASDLFAARYLFLDVFIDQNYHLDDFFDFPVVIPGDSSFKMNKAFDAYEQAASTGAKMQALYAILEQLMALATERKVCRNHKIYPVLEYLRAHYAEHISIADMASLLQISESGFYTIFKKEMGTSPIKYLNDYRLSVARDLLLHTNDSMKEIAESVGIVDQFYFSRLFKTKYKMSPQKYRKENFY